MDKQIQTLQDKILEFRNARNWKQFHNPKDLAISINLEAAELLENFQWSGEDLQCANKREQIKDEIADILIYSLLMAHDLDINVEKAILEKLEKNNKKYPVEKAKGSSKKYTEL